MMLTNHKYKVQDQVQDKPISWHQNFYITTFFFSKHTLRGESFTIFAHFCKVPPAKEMFQQIPCEIDKNADLQKLHCEIPLNFGKNVYILSEKQVTKVVVILLISSFSSLICKFWIRNL